MEILENIDKTKERMKMKEIKGEVLFLADDVFVGVGSEFGSVMDFERIRTTYS